MELTLLELNLEEPSFRANAPFSGRQREEESGTGIDVSSEEGGRSGPSPKAFVVGLVFLVGVGLAVRRMMSSGSSSVEEETEAEPITA